MREQTEWNVIFLLDQTPPTKVVMLKRSPNKKFAPNFYTGIGGKVDEGETIEASAYRELQEETGIANITLTEFARCIIDHKYSLFYFWGVYDNENLPYTDDGILEWVDTEEILSKDIIPTTKAMCQVWHKRNFHTDNPFTLYVREIGKSQTVTLVTPEELQQGLLK